MGLLCAEDGLPANQRLIALLDTPGYTVVFLRRRDKEGSILDSVPGHPPMIGPISGKRGKQYNKEQAMPADLPVKCFCGALDGVVRDLSSRGANRIICYCNDSQAFERE